MLPLRDPSQPPSNVKRPRLHYGSLQAQLPHMEELHNTDVFFALHVLSTTTSPVRMDGAIVPGVFGFYGPPQHVDESLVQLAWATSPDNVK